MKKWMLCAAFVTVAAPFAAVAEEGEEKKEAEETAEVTLTGEVVELSCYVKGQRGEEHIDCALQCLDNGLPVAFVVTEEDKEQLYFVLFEDGTAPVDMLYDYVGTEVDLTGKV